MVKTLCMLLCALVCVRASTVNYAEAPTELLIAWPLFSLALGGLLFAVLLLYFRTENANAARSSEYTDMLPEQPGKPLDAALSQLQKLVLLAVVLATLATTIGVSVMLFSGTSSGTAPAYASAGTRRRSSSTTSVVCMRVSADVRTGPYSSATSLGRAPVGMAFQLQSSALETWRYMTLRDCNNGRTVYIHGSYLQSCTSRCSIAQPPATQPPATQPPAPLPAPLPLPVPSSNVDTVCATTSVSMRQGPGTQYTRVGTARTGDAFTLVSGSLSRSYAQVRSCSTGRTVYVYGIYLRQCNSRCGGGGGPPPTPRPTLPPLPQPRTPPPPRPTARPWNPPSPAPAGGDRFSSAIEDRARRFDFSFEADCKLSNSGNYAVVKCRNGYPYTNTFEISTTSGITLDGAWQSNRQKHELRPEDNEYHTVMRWDRVATSYSYTVLAGGAGVRLAGEFGVPWRQSRVVNQGFFGRFSHNNAINYHAIDVTMPQGTPVLAARRGIVVEVEESLPDRGSQRANRVRLLHADGSMSLYVHMPRHGVHVSLGQMVEEGTHIADAGTSGQSTGPHLHFSVSAPDGSNQQMVTVPWKFRPNTTPREWDSYGRDAGGVAPSSGRNNGQANDGFDPPLATQEVLCTTAHVNRRDAPSLSGSKLGVAAPGDPFTLVEEISGTSYNKYKSCKDGSVSYLSGAYLRPCNKPCAN